MILMVVDLPAPFGPRKPWTVPRSTSRSSPSRAVVEPKRFINPPTEITAVMC
jgi:hypothetical protein